MSQNQTKLLNRIGWNQIPCRAPARWMKLSSKAERETDGHREGRWGDKVSPALPSSQSDDVLRYRKQTTASSKKGKKKKAVQQKKAKPASCGHVHTYTHSPQAHGDSILLACHLHICTQGGNDWATTHFDIYISEGRCFIPIPEAGDGTRPHDLLHKQRRTWGNVEIFIQRQRKTQTIQANTHIVQVYMFWLAEAGFVCWDHLFGLWFSGMMTLPQWWWWWWK